MKKSNLGQTNSGKKIGVREGGVVLKANRLHEGNCMMRHWHITSLRNSATHDLSLNVKKQRLKTGNKKAVSARRKPKMRVLLEKRSVVTRGGRRTRKTDKGKTLEEKKKKPRRPS